MNVKLHNLFLLLLALTSGTPILAQVNEDPRLIYPVIENSSLSPFSSIGTLEHGTGELVRKDLVITAAHVAVDLQIDISEFIPAASSGAAPFGRYKVKEIIYSESLRSNPELMKNTQTGAQYWENEARSDFAFVRIEPIDLKKNAAIKVLKLSKRNPCRTGSDYYLSGYGMLWPMGTLRSSVEPFSHLGCNSDESLVYFNGLTIRGFSGGLVSDTRNSDAQIMGILVAGGRAPGAGRCSAEQQVADPQHCGLWAVPAWRISSELKLIP